MKFLILGAGPAGLMAAHAAALNNHDVIIASRKGRKSKMMGAQYLHAPIPMATTSPAFTIHYDLIGGTEEEYSNKVYGNLWDGSVSPEDLEKTHDAWDIREAYDWLWDTYGDYVMDWDCTGPASIGNLFNWAKPDVKISTVPAPLLCERDHSFTSSSIWSSDKEMMPIPDNHVVLNAGEAPRWYRSARIQGWDTVEWPHSVRPPVNPLWEVVKPLKHNCTCHPDVHRMGRYGKWTKGVLSHEAFYETAKINQEQGVLF